ncbi:MAG: hypothetical protein GXO57_03290 [Thermodesulfobacteria bacterium]|nr:hypothetical protein [Thermodesulfobacteriota bacterium]
MKDCVSVLVGFSPHRIEVLPWAKRFMEKADVIILEEPANLNFKRLLEDRFNIEEYLSGSDFWFPGFVKETIKILKEQFKKGTKIFQVEPYFTFLRKIQQEEDKSLLNNFTYKKVYEVEHIATLKLLEYYEASLSKEFEEVVKAVIEFSKADAKRFRLRDLLRAKAVTRLIGSLKSSKNIYIESGTIHVYFKKLLHQMLKGIAKIRHVYLLEEVLKPLVGKAWVFPPGETLTLRYILKNKPNPEKEKLLAARSLIYIKIIPKEELTPTQEEPYPHLKRELLAIKMVNRLSFEDCRRLYKEIFFIKNYKEARDFVENYIKTRLGGIDISEV